MKILTMANFNTTVNKMLATKVRWNDTLDQALCDSVINNLSNPVLTQGIAVTPPASIEVSGIQCTLYVIYNPYMVISRGWAVAGCLTDTISQIVVFVDDDFMAMSKNTQEFIVWHEIGHIEHRHNSVMLIRNIKHEYEADLFAKTRSNADGVQALTEISKYVTTLSKIELRKRITALVR